jgi:type II secretory ATPase GspE/PulE/Tfp pilus assembly ATPase PilB-like protein
VSFPKAKMKSTKFYRGIPNRSNHNSGYKGRTAIHEILEVDNPMKKLIYDGANQNEIKKTALKNGMTPLREAGISKVINGSTTIEEILRATVEDI